jgi:hypothetical protein
VLAIVHHRDSTFRDATFVRDADAVCAQSQTKVRDGQLPGEDATLEQRATSVERIDSILTDMAHSLRALPVDDIDALPVERWLDDLDSFIAVGPRYAAAIRSGDERHAEDVGNEGDAPNDRFNAAARANGIKHCLLG